MISYYILLDSMKGDAKMNLRRSIINEKARRAQNIFNEQPGKNNLFGQIERPALPELLPKQMPRELPRKLPEIKRSRTNRYCKVNY